MSSTIEPEPRHLCTAHGWREESFLEEGEVLKCDLQRKPEPPTFWQRLRASIFGKHTLPEDEGPHPLRDLPWLR